MYGVILLAVIGFGIFGLAALFFSLRLPRPVRLFFLCGGSLSILLQYVAIWGDLNKYPDAFEWYDTFLLPGYVLMLPSVWMNWGAIFGLAVPAMAVLFNSLGSLSEDDLDKSITIRQQPLTVAEALTRSVCHAAYHTGQIVLLARNFAGQDWKSPSIPKGQSAAYNQNPTLEK